MSKIKLWPDQIVPLFLTTVVFGVMWLLFHGEILGLNKMVVRRAPISPSLEWSALVLGVTIYLKTAIDFAIFIGRLMSKYGGWKNRIMIEIGTALGNAVGTMGILLIWDLFREVKWLMAIMIGLASLVLLKLAEEGFEHVKDAEGKYVFELYGLVGKLEHGLEKFNQATAPILSRLIPELKVKDKGKGYKHLFLMSFTIPFILGLDDFAGYIPLFNVVNVYGFGVGVFLGHMILNIFLFLSPKDTIRAVKHPVISFLGSVVFVGLAVWGWVEVVRLVGW